MHVCFFLLFAYDYKLWPSPIRALLVDLSGLQFDPCSIHHSACGSTLCCKFVFIINIQSNFLSCWTFPLVMADPLTKITFLLLPLPANEVN